MRNIEHVVVNLPVWLMSCPCVPLAKLYTLYPRCVPAARLPARHRLLKVDAAAFATDLSKKTGPTVADLHTATDQIVVRSFRPSSSIA